MAKIEKAHVDSQGFQKKWLHSTPQLDKKKWPKSTKLFKSTVQGIPKGMLEPWEPKTGACSKCGGKGFTMEKTTRPGRLKSITCDLCN